MLRFSIALFFMALFLPLSTAQADWRQGMKLPASLAYAEAAVIDGEIYVLRNNRHAGKDKFFEAYDIRGDGWRPLLPLPVDRHDFAMAVSLDQLFVTGGINPETDAMSNGMWMYSARKAQWYQFPPMPGKRAHHRSVIIDPYLYIIGGQGDDMDKIYRYHLTRSVWESLPLTINLPTRAFAAVADGEDIIIAGGRDDNNIMTDKVWSYNTQDKDWQQLARLPRPMSGGGLVQQADGLHFLGGYSQTPEKTWDTHYLLANNRREWVALEALPAPRHHAAVVGFENRIFMLGGAVGVGFYAFFTATDNVFIYQP